MNATNSTIHEDYYYDDGYDNHMSWGGAIAGIVIALVVTLLVVSIIAWIARGRRRRGLSYLPGPAGITTWVKGPSTVNNPYVPPPPPPEHWGPAPPYDASVPLTPMNPPKYKESMGYVDENGMPQPGGFMPPPGPPPEAHINGNPRSV
ncbi:hypothetical protein C8Q75DRAFT_805260 [Abortiporus biennis]|nr:hypothetical protein C8Q75DRAFT_805260 [Abortiporus biennis]